MAAEVIYSDPSSLERVITIGKGTDDGLFQGAAVLSPGGSLVGAITDLGGNWANVRLISDTRSVVVGRDVRSRATGEVHGNLSAPLQMLNVPFNQDLRVGDLITTAGIRLGREARSQYPRDLVIGSIVNVDRDPAGITISALVQPASDLDGLEFVYVITDFRPDPLAGRHATPTPEPTDEAIRRARARAHRDPATTQDAAAGRRLTAPGGRRRVGLWVGASRWFLTIMHPWDTGPGSDRRGRSHDLDSARHDAWRLWIRGRPTFGGRQPRRASLGGMDGTDQAGACVALWLARIRPGACVALWLARIRPGRARRAVDLISPHLSRGAVLGHHGARPPVTIWVWIRSLHTRDPV